MISHREQQEVICNQANKHKACAGCFMAEPHYVTEECSKWGDCKPDPDSEDLIKVRCIKVKNES